MSLPIGGFFSSQRFSSPSMLILHSWGRVTWAQKVHCNLCNKCYTLGMPCPRPDIRCVQYLPKVHPKVPIKISVPSGTSEVIDWHQRAKTLLNVETEIHHIMGWIYHIIGVEGRSSRSPTDVHAHKGTSKIHYEDVPAPVESYRTHLTPLLGAGWSTSFLDLKLKLIIFFSRPELHVTCFSLRERSYSPA